MQKTVQMLTDVRDLLIPCSGLGKEDLYSLAKQTFDDSFMDNAQRGTKVTHDAEEVVFYSDRFEHAFCAKEDTSVINLERFERLPWVIPMIQGRVPNSQCWLQTEFDCEKRIYVCFGLGYIVFLRSRDTTEGWTFRTAYVADGRYLRSKLNGGKLIARF